MNEFARTPCNQPFIKMMAVERAHHKSGKNLERRLTEYARMVSQNKIGSGARGEEGYRKPGSNKK